VFGSEFDLLLGRRTYEIFAGYWPFQSMDNPIADKFAKADKYLITRAGTSLDWDTTHRLTDLDALAAAKQGEGPNLVIQGSSTLYPQLIARGLLDRLILMIAPITLGAGKRLFGEGTPAKSFRLVEQRTGAGGIVALTYDLAGSVETGTFATEPPTDLELARRARVAAGTW
jgi:dihydrofolate reductase